MRYNFEAILLFDTKNVPSFIWTKEGISTLKDGFKERDLLLTVEKVTLEKEN